MARNKITVVGAGNVGATTAHIAATRRLGDVVMIDVVDGLAAGKALDMAEAAPIQYFDADTTRLNVNGGAIAMGHPLGATGAILLSTLLDEMERTDKETGLVTLCIGSGMGAATIIERV